VVAKPSADLFYFMWSLLMGFERES
jgi:hypothetical protein